MNQTFQTLKDIGVKGPFDFRPFRFVGWLDTDQQFHLREHAGVTFASSEKVAKAASRAFPIIAPCCARKSQWLMEGNISARSMSAEAMMKARQTVLDVIFPLRNLQPTTSSEAFDAIWAASNVTWPAVKIGDFSTLAWEEAFKLEVEKEVTRFKAVFDETDKEPFLLRVAQGALSPFPKPTRNPEVNRIIEQAKIDAVSALALSPTFVIGSAPKSSSRKDMEIFKRLYGVGTKNLIKVPEAVFEVLKRSMKDVALTEDVDAKTIEALDVLYQPSSDGPYSKIVAALEASKAL